MVNNSITKPLISNKKISYKKEILVFLSLVFTLTYLLNLIMWLNYDIIEENILLLSSATGVQMIIPAFSAIILNLFVFKTNNYNKKSKILFYCFLSLCTLFVLVFIFLLFNPIDITTNELGSIENLSLILILSLLNLSILILTIGWIVLVFYWNLKSDSRKELKATKLSFGKSIYYLVFTLFFVGYFLLSTILNWVFNLGSPPSEPSELGALLLGFATIFLAPLFAFPRLFGEEYGWRIYLQDRLAKQYSRFKTVLLIGLVWGFWHIPLIILQEPYSNNLVLGIIVYTIGTILFSILIGLATFKTKSVWIAAYLHGVINVQNVFSTYFYNPNDYIYSFGMGIYGLPILTALLLIFLKAREWKEKDK